MIDLTAAQSMSRGRLNKLGIERDGTDKDGLVYHLALAFDVENEADADVVNRFLPGARAYYDHKQGKDTTGAFRDNQDVSGRFQLVYAIDGLTVVDHVGSVTRVELIKSKKATVCTIHADFHGLPAVTAAHFAAHLDREMLVTFTAPIPAQQGIPFALPAATNAVQVVTVTDGIDGFLFGVQQGADAGRVLLDDFGRAFEAPSDRIISRVVVAPDEGISRPMFELVAPMATKIRDAGGSPSWKWVLLALAEAFGNDVESAVQRVSPKLLDRAADLAIDSVVQ